MGYAKFLLTKAAWAEAGFTEEEFIKDFNSGLFDYILPNLAADFLRQFPTLQAAVKKFDKPINMSGHSTDTLAAVEQLLNLTVEEAGLLVSAKPLVMQFKESLLAQGARPTPTEPRAQPPQTSAAANRSPRIFLCHATNDKPAVRELYQRLRADGIDADASHAPQP